MHAKTVLPPRSVRRQLANKLRKETKSKLNLRDYWRSLQTLKVMRKKEEN